MASVSRSAASVTASRFSGIVAVSMLAATYAVAPSPAAAIEGLPPHCAKAGNELAQLKCGTAHYRQRRLDAEARSADAKARGAAADARGSAADKQIAENQASKACYDALLDEVNTAKKIAPLTPEQKTVFKNRAAGCEKS